MALSWPYRSTCPTLYADWGAAQSGWGHQQHATSIIPLESSTLNPGSWLRHAKESGQEARGDPGGNSADLGKWRRGRRSLRTVTPSTRGTCPLAKAPSLWQEGVQRESAHKGPSERASCPRAFVSWRPAQGHPTRVQSCGCRRKGHRGFMGVPWRSTTGVEPEAVPAARPVLNGGDEETCGNVTRLVPTQPGYFPRLMPGVRLRAAEV